jgi:nickel transport protein
VSEAVKQEVRPLRREIAAYQETHDIQSILGGLGYILGLVGVVFYLMARRRLSMAP